MDVHRINYMHIYIGTDVKVLEVLLWGRIASQPHFPWLVSVVWLLLINLRRCAPGQVQRGGRLEPASPRGLLPTLWHTGGERSGLTMPVFNLQV